MDKYFYTVTVEKQSSNGKRDRRESRENSRSKVRSLCVVFRVDRQIQHRGNWLWVQGLKIVVNFLISGEKLLEFSAILVLFLNLKIGYDKNTSTAIFHTYVFLAYLLPLLGSIIADSWWGQFKTLVWMALVFTSGALMIAVATIDELHLPIA